MRPNPFAHNNPDRDNTGTEVEFRAERRSLNLSKDLHDHPDEVSHNGNEMGWLVSYADMMTLLFGLFVILFSLLVQSPAGQADKMMRDVSKKYFGGTVDQPPTLSPAVEASATPAPQISPVAAPTIAATPIPSPSPAPTPSMGNPAELLAAKAQITGLEKQVTDLEDEIKAKELELRAAKGEPKTSAKEQIERVASLEKTVKELQSHADELEQKLTAQKSQNDALQKEIEKKEAKAPTQNYVATMLVWDTEKHDLDLVIEDPTGKHFDFKHRKFTNNPGHFELDSRYGPGIEMWKAENFAAGTYHAVVKLYSQNGNDQPAKGHVTIVTNLSTYQSPPIELHAPGDKTTITFTIDSTGAVEFGK